MPDVTRTCLKNYSTSVIYGTSWVKSISRSMALRIKTQQSVPQTFRDKSHRHRIAAAE